MIKGSGEGPLIGSYTAFALSPQMVERGWDLSGIPFRKPLIPFLMALPLEVPSPNTITMGNRVQHTKSGENTNIHLGHSPKWDWACSNQWSPLAEGLGSPEEERTLPPGCVQTQDCDINSSLGLQPIACSIDFRPADPTITSQFLTINLTCLHRYIFLLLFLWRTLTNTVLHIIKHSNQISLQVSIYFETKISLQKRKKSGSTRTQSKRTWPKRVKGHGKSSPKVIRQPRLWKRR